MSCYLPVLEKIKAAIKSEPEQLKIKSRPTQEIRQIYPCEIERFPEENHPQRQQNGLVLRQNYGVFPRQINLEIRHTNATLGLGEVAQIRQQHNVNAVYQNSENKGVLSLGLPEKFMPKNFSGTSPQRKPPISATSEAICHYYETLNPKYANIVTINRQKKKSRSTVEVSEITDFKDLDTTIKTTDSGQVSGGSSIGSHSPPGVGLVPPMKPPPRHLLPTKLKPSPGVKMHPTGIVPHFREIADNASLSVEETGSNSATESDSIGRNSSPENSNKIRTSPGHFNRLSPMVTGNSTTKLQKQILKEKHQDLGYHTMLSKHVVPTCSTSSLESTDHLWDVRATKTPIRDLKIMTHNARVISRSATPKIESHRHRGKDLFESLPESVILRIFSGLSTNDLIKCSRVNRRFYFLCWEPELWTSVVLTGEQTDADLALKTIFRLLARNSAHKHGLERLQLNGCSRLTDRGLAIVARMCPHLTRLEIQHCSNITNGGIMDLVTKCQLLDHLDVTGCHMISSIKVHQPPSTPNPALRGASAVNTLLPNLRRLDHLQYLDLTDCTSLGDAGLKMVVETCPQLLYLFLRRCTGISDIGIKYVASYCLQLRELSISDCSHITDFGLYELAKLGPNLRYLSVAKCDQISDAGVKQIARLCYKLRYLNVRGCEAVSDEAIEMLARSCSRLRSLDIGKCDVTDVGLKLLSENCPNLKKLSVKSCEMVSDRGIQCVAYYCRGLQQLNIQDCPITQEGYRMVKKFCKRCIIEHSHPGFF